MSLTDLFTELNKYQANFIIMGKAALYLTAGVLLAWVSGKVWDKFVGRMAARTATELDGRLVLVSHRPLVVLVFLVSVKSLVKSLGNEAAALPGAAFLGFLDNLFYALAVVVIAFWVDSCIQTALAWYSGEYAQKNQSSLEQFLPLVRQLVRILVYFLALTFILEHFGKNITGLIATAGVASLAIALAAQETLSNMLAGLMIMIDRPFRPGDRIEMENGQLGDVLQIGTRTTRILTLDNTVIVVPNKELANSRIVNHVFPTPRVTLRLRVGVAYDSDLSAVKAVLNGILAENQRVLEDPAPNIFFTDFGDSSLNLLIVCWIEDFKNRFAVMDELNTEIKARFERAGIVIPFPRRDISFIPAELKSALGQPVEEEKGRQGSVKASN